MTKRLIVVLALAVALVPLSVVAGATPASAALPHCTDWTTDHGSFDVTLPSVGNNSRNFNCKLQFGDANAGVWIVQDALNVCFGIALARDAFYGRVTADVIGWMQAASGAGIAVDKVYGPDTARYALKWPAFINGQFRGCIKVTF